MYLVCQRNTSSSGCVSGCTSRKEVQQVPLSLVELPSCLLTSQNHLNHTNVGISVFAEELMTSTLHSPETSALFPIVPPPFPVVSVSFEPWQAHVHTQTMSTCHSKLHRQTDRYLYFLCSMLTARFRLLTLRLVLYDLQAAWITQAALTWSLEA